MLPFIHDPDALTRLCDANGIRYRFEPFTGAFQLMDSDGSVLVHLRQLLQQWVERLSMFLDLPVNAIGRLGGGRKDVTGTLDVAIIQSLVRNGVEKDMVGDYGHLVVDECHHLSAGSFEQVARRAKAKFVT